MRSVRKRSTDFYWTCANENHRHKTQRVAERCINFHPDPPRNRKRWTPQKIGGLVRAKNKGATCKELGKRHGVSAGRISELLRHAKWCREELPEYRRQWKAEEKKRHKELKDLGIQFEKDKKLISDIESKDLRIAFVHDNCCRVDAFSGLGEITMDRMRGKFSSKYICAGSYYLATTATSAKYYLDYLAGKEPYDGNAIYSTGRF